MAELLDGGREQLVGYMTGVAALGGKQRRSAKHLPDECRCGALGRGDELDSVAYVELQADAVEVK